jgi:signal transduction histidine kinase
MVARGEPWGEVLGALSRSLEGLGDGCFCGVLLVTPDRKRFHLGAGPRLASVGNALLDGVTIDSGDTPYSAAVIEKARIITADLVNDRRWEGSPWAPRMQKVGFGSCSATPIISASGDVHGVVTIHRSQPVTPTAEEAELVDRIAKIAAIAIDHALAENALNRARSELAHVARVTALNAMSASIAHEVNQPLSGILTNASTCLRMLAAEPPNLAGAAETAQRTIRDAERALDVIRRLRAMFATKATSAELADLNEVAREVIALSAGELQRSGARLQTDFADDLPRVSVDRVQVQQVILNLLLNATDAMAGIVDRPRALLVRTSLQDDGGVLLAVRDSGVGVDPQAAERLFAAFYTTKPKGMGIGLSISRSIIENHNGRLWAEANDGPGATFSFRIPAPPMTAERRRTRRSRPSGAEALKRR